MRGWQKGAYTLSDILTPLPLQFLVAQSWLNFSAMSYNALSWFVSTLLGCYLFFPYLGRWLYGRKSLRQLVWFVSAILLAEWAAEEAVLVTGSKALNGFLYVNPLARVWDFAVGMAFGLAFLRYGKARPAGNYSLAQLVLCGVWALSVYAGGKDLRDGGWIPAYFILLCACLVYFLAFDGVAARLLSARPLVWLGNLSMECYFIHQLMIWNSQTLLRKVGFDYELQTLWPLSLALTVGMAYAWQKGYGRLRRRRAA